MTDNRPAQPASWLKRWPLLALLMAASVIGVWFIQRQPKDASPQASAPLIIESAPWQAGQAVRLTVRTHPVRAGQNVAITILPPAAESLAGSGLAGVQLVWLTPEQRETEILLAAASGAESIGLDFDWQRIEPQAGQFDWTETDAVLALARQYNLRLVPMLLFTPQWASSAAQAPLDYHRAPPTDFNAYRDFVYAVVERYKPYGTSPLTADGYGIRDWGIWNEPNVNPAGQAPLPGAFWTGSLEAYIQLLRAGYEGAHAADPGCNVLNGALADVYWQAGEADLATALERFYDPNGDGDASDGGRPYFDTLNIHIYQLGAPEIGWYTQRFEIVERIMRRFGDDDKPIWVTETGYGTASPPDTAIDDASPYVDEATQAEAVRLVYQAMAEHPRVERIFWWSLRDYYHDASAANQAMEAHYGLLRSDFSPKPAYWAFARLAPGSRSALKLGGLTDENGAASFVIPADFAAQPGRYVVFAALSPQAGQARPAPLIAPFYSAAPVEPASR